MSKIQKDFFKKHNEYKIITLLLKNGEAVRTKLFGYCMRPFIKNGEIVTIKPIKLEELRCGDIVVYQSGDRLKAHRFLKFKTISGDTYIITKGDKSIHVDPPISLNRFLGKVTDIEKGDRIISFESMKWKIINYFFGKLFLYLSIMKYSYIHSRRHIGTFIKYVIGERNTGRIKKILHRTNYNI
jgi:signal peptidase I